MINPFLEFTVVNLNNKETWKFVLHMAHIESVADRGGRATIFAASGTSYVTTSKWLTVMAAWQQYDRLMQEEFQKEDFEDKPHETEEEEDDSDAKPFNQ